MAVGLNTLVENAAADGAVGVLPYMSLHTAEPDENGSNESTASRQSLTWTAAANSQTSVTAGPFTGGAASGPCTHAGFWSAATGGTFYGALDITGDQMFNAAGEYTSISGTVTAQ